MSADKEAEEREPIAHHNVVVMSTRDAAEMDALVANSTLRGVIWRRLDATHALVDPTAIMQIRERLEAAGIAASVGEMVPPGD